MTKEHGRTSTNKAAKIFFNKLPSILPSKNKESIFRAVRFQKYNALSICTHQPEKNQLPYEAIVILLPLL